MSSVIVKAFFDEATNTSAISSPTPRRAVPPVIDPVLDYDHKSGKVETRSLDAILAAAHAAGYAIDWTLETHAHADHLSGSPHIRAKTGACIGIGARITEVQRIFRPVFKLPTLQPTGAILIIFSGTASDSGSAHSTPRFWLRLAIRQLASATRSKMRSSSAIRCSCRILERRVLISRVVTRTSSIARSVAS